MAAPTFTKTSEQTVVTRTYTVDGAVPERRPRDAGRPDIIRPTLLTVRITDGSASGVDVRGPRVKVDGTDSLVTGGWSYLGRRDWPAWVVTFLDGMGL